MGCELTADGKCKSTIQAQDGGIIINLSEAEWPLMMDIFKHYEQKRFSRESGI